MARPIVWNDKLKENAITEIIQRISDGESCRSILKPNHRGDHLPSHRLFIEWISNDEILRKQYAYACEVRADLMFEDILEIADDGSSDYTEEDLGDDIKVQKLNSENIQRSRLRVDARKWALSKMNPKKYGDKQEIDHKNNGGKFESTTNVTYESFNDKS